MLRTDHIEIDGHPMVRFFGIKNGGRIMRIGIAQEIPRGIDERVEGLGVAFCLAAAFRALHVDEFF